MTQAPLSSIRSALAGAAIRLLVFVSTSKGSRMNGGTTYHDKSITEGYLQILPEWNGNYLTELSA
jgi:small ligand-binding sensory domain FIST